MATMDLTFEPRSIGTFAQWCLIDPYNDETDNRSLTVPDEGAVIPSGQSAYFGDCSPKAVSNVCYACILGTSRRKTYREACHGKTSPTCTQGGYPGVAVSVTEHDSLAFMHTVRRTDVPQPQPRTLTDAPRKFMANIAHNILQHQRALHALS